MVKVAIFNGQSYHHHCMGYIIEYCHDRKYDYSIYAYHKYVENNLIYICQQGMMWKEYYDNLWQKEWLLPQTFHPDNYDVIFVPTDDDNAINQECIDKYRHKMIFMDLYYLIRVKNSLHNIATRYYPKNPRPWVMQCFRGINKLEKMKYIEENRSAGIINVLITGGAEKYHPTNEELKRLFINYENIRFTIICLHDLHKYDENVTMYTKLYDQRYIDINNRTDYIFCNDVPDGKDDVCKSSIFMSFCFGAKLIIPESWQEHYKFNSAMTFRSYDDPIYLPPLSKSDINKVFYERERFIEQKNQLFDDTIQKIMYS